MRLTRHRVHPTHDCRSDDRRPRRAPSSHTASAPRRARLIRFCAARPLADDTTTPRTSSASERRRRRSRRRVLVLVEVAVLAVVLAGSVHAQTTTVLALAGSVDQVLNNIRDWLMGILAALATVFLTVGGVRRVLGGGDPGEQEKAKTCFKSAAIGYGLAALAPLVVTVLKGIVGA